MDQPRFQVDIGTIMFVVAIVAISIAVMSVPDYFFLVDFVLIPLAIRLVIPSCMKARCRTEGSEPGQPDRVKADRLTFWLVLSYFGVALIVGLAWKLSVP